MEVDISSSLPSQNIFVEILRLFLYDIFFIFSIDWLIDWLNRIDF